MKKELKELVAERRKVQAQYAIVNQKIHRIQDGYHYRAEYSQFENHWQEEYPNEVVALDNVMRCYCADIEGYATLYTNNPELIESERDWGDVDIVWESA